MRHLEDGPPLHALFSTDAPLDAELRRMLAWVHVIRDSDDWQDALDDASEVPDDAPEPLLEHIRQGDVPPFALDVLAGLTGTILTKDYRMCFLWAAAWGLLERPPGEPLPDDDAEVAEETLEQVEERIADLKGQLAALQEHQKVLEIEEQRKAEAGVDPQVEIFMRARQAGPQARDLRRGIEPDLATPSADHQSTAARVALLGFDGTDRFSARESRMILWHYRDMGPAWVALCAALDAVGAASHAGLERLSALADAHPDSPAILWLAEIACRVARDDKALARAAQLDALLDSGTLGQNAPHLVYILKHGREHEMAKNGTAIHDAWLRLGGMHRPEPPHEDARDKLTPAQRAAIRRGAKQGLPGAVAIVAMDAFYDRIISEEQREIALEGPFRGLHSPPPEVGKMVDHALHYLIHGFREAYSLELLRDGIPRLEAWLSEAQGSAEKSGKSGNEAI